MPSDLEKAARELLAVTCYEPLSGDAPHVTVGKATEFRFAALESALREQEPDGELNSMGASDQELAGVAAAQPQPDDGWNHVESVAFASPAPEPPAIADAVQPSERIKQLQAELTALREDAQRVVDAEAKLLACRFAEEWVGCQREREDAVAALRSRLAQPEKERKS